MNLSNAMRNLLQDMLTWRVKLVRDRWVLYHMWDGVWCETVYTANAATLAALRSRELVAVTTTDGIEEATLTDEGRKVAQSYA